MAGPFYFAWVDEEETTFGPEHLVEDEQIESFSMEHAEGANPTLSINIRNPRVGLLAPGRQTWAWFSVENDSTGGVEPILFGQLVGIPSNILGEVATLVFIARASDHGARKQAVAETLKVPPAYDRIFIDPALADDPDTVLEGYSKLWHVDRTTVEVTVSDIIVGEDGVEEFTEDEVPYTSVSLTKAQTPLRSVRVDASVSWTQTGGGYVDVFGVGSGSIYDPNEEDSEGFVPGLRIFDTYTGDGIIGDWPKVGAELQGGYSVAPGTHAIDLNGVPSMEIKQYNWRYVNTQKEHENGDILTNTFTASAPAGRVPAGSGGVAGGGGTGLADLGINIIATVSGHGFYFDPYADPQINIPYDVQSHGLTIPKWKVETTLLLRYDVALQRIERLRFTLSSDLQAITTAASEGDSEVLSIQGIDVGQPLLNVLNWITVSGQAVALGQLIKAILDDGTVTYQIATTAGTAGTVEPTFSDFLGDTTVDGTVTWTSLGTTLFSADVPEWVAADPTPLGQVISPEGVPEYMLCTTAGTTGATEPVFNTAVGSTTVDNTVTWTSLGTAGAFIGIPIGDTSRGVFFPTDRGTRAIEYLLSVARAHQMMRARAVNVSWECSFNRALGLSCRMNARLYDPRLPGGDALGKIISYTIQGDGPSGKLFGTVTIGCAIGKGNSVEVVEGDPDYVDESVLGPEVQVFLNSTIVLPSEDIGYSRPIDIPSPDDLNFPLTSEQIIISEQVHFGLPEQEEAITEANEGGYVVDESSAEGAVVSIAEGQETYKQRIQTAMRAKSVWYELTLRALQGGPLENRYDMEVTTMTVPRMIDLEADTTA